MQISIIILLTLVSPLLLLLYAWLSKSSDNGKIELVGISGERLGQLGILISLLIATLVYQFGPYQSPTLGWNGLGFSLRLDTLSVIMLIMISILGYVILKFSSNYMDGEPKKNLFLKRLAFTIASVELLILSGNLFQIFFFWIITSMCLHSLLVFYRNRPQAVAAARKKFIVARLGDASLLAALVCIYLALGTGDLGAIFNHIQSSDFTMTNQLIWGMGLLVVAAALKSAQFPTHGWLIEVVETPTPVSALLHAGLLNAGPFLMVRMSHLVVESTAASIMLILIGGLTAMIASVIFMTQPSVKVALGYSSVAHMGFSLLICGFGIYSAAILHVVAHSFYKAHSFLSSGSVVDRVRARKVNLPARNGKIQAIVLSVALAAGLFALFCYMWGIRPAEHFSLMALGTVIVMGLSQLLISTLDVKTTWKSHVVTSGISLAVYTSFFSLEHGSRLLFGSQVATSYQPGPTVQAVIAGLLIMFAIVILLQLISPALKQTAFGYRLGIHLRNGLYVNVIFDRMIGSLKNEKFKWINLTVQEDAVQAHTERQEHKELVPLQKLSN
ncbi:MAG: proton-conducting transporter membrane subunit [Ekhidna sp.]